MKRIFNTIIIGVDHGYGNVKTANTITPSAVLIYESEPVFSGNILEYKDKYYRIGEGHKEFVSDKTGDDDYYVLTLMAVAKELEFQGISSADVHIAAGLPLTWVRRQREAFRSYLLKDTDVKFRFNGMDYHVRFTGCSLFPQSYPAVISQLRDFSGTTLLADIGNGTMNILYFNDRKPVESRCWTEKCGVHQCMIAAQNAVMDQFGTKIDPAVIEQIIRCGTANIGSKYLKCITDICRRYCCDIFDALRRYEYNPELMRLYIIGGGGSLIRNFGEYDENTVTIISDLCATARGYEMLAFESLCRKERK